MVTIKQRWTSMHTEAREGVPRRRVMLKMEIVDMKSYIISLYELHVMLIHFMHFIYCLVIVINRVISHLTKSNKSAPLKLGSTYNVLHWV